MQGWELRSDADQQQQVEALLEPLLVRGILPNGHRSATAMFLGEEYHLGGAEDTRRMARIAMINAEDMVVDLACYVGGPARHLAREFGCRVTGVDLSPVHIAIAQRLSELTGLSVRTRFICASAEAVPVADGAFSVVWSQGAFPPDLSWLPEIRRLLRPGGRLAFTGQIWRSAQSEQGTLSLDEIRERLAEFGFRVIHADDISAFESEYGWLPARRKLAEDEERYRSLLGDDWVRWAYESLDADITAWRARRAGDGRIVAARET